LRFFYLMTDIVKTYPNGGVIEVYRQVDRDTSDYDRIFACCEYFAMQGKRVVITPRFTVTTVNEEYIAIYASLRGTPYWGKCPDFCVDGVWYEHEGYDKNKDLTDRQKKADSFCWMMKRGLKQSGRVIVEDCGVGRFFAKRTIYNRIHIERQNISEVYIRTDKGLELLYKKGEG